jgi:hypothetical protein
MSKQGPPKGFDLVGDKEAGEASGCSAWRAALIAGGVIFVGVWVMGLAYVVIQHQKSKTKDGRESLAAVAKAPTKEWLETSEEFRDGGIQVRVTRASIYRPELTSVQDKTMTFHDVRSAGRMLQQHSLASPPEHPERCFCLSLSICSVDQNDPLKFEGWGDVGNFTIKDNLGNKYKRVKCAADSLFAGQFVGKNAIIYSGEIMSKGAAGGNASDVIVVEDPKREAKTLFIELPADAFGKKGVIKFRWEIDRFIHSNIAPPKAKANSK